MELLYFFFLMALLSFATLWRPGMVLAYLLVFQGLNNLAFGLVDLSVLRYSTTLLALPAVVLLHNWKPTLGTLSTAALRSPIAQGFLLITVYIAVYAAATGGGHEISFLVSFLVPGVVLFGIGSAITFTAQAYRDLFAGVVIFAVLTFLAILAFNVSTVDAFYAERSAAGASTGMSVITQGRIAGLIAVAAVILIVEKTGPLRWLGAGALVVGTYWLFLAGSRGPAVALLVTVVLYSVFSAEKRLSLVYPVLVIATLIVVFFQFGMQDSPLVRRTVATALESDYLVTSQRFNRWVIFFQFIPDHALFGLGPGGWGKYVWESVDSYPHNLVIEFVLDYGLVGFISMTMIVIGGVVATLRVVRSATFSLSQRAVALFWFYFLLNTMVSGGFVHGNQPFFALTGLMVPLSLQAARMVRKKRTDAANSHRHLTGLPTASPAGH